jgi:hypothetical protein
MAAALAKRLRAVREHDDDERYDLAGYTQTQAEELMSLAFADPIEATTPLRFTFIIGGGKLVRTRYPEELGKWLMAAGRKLGFEDDRGASLGMSMVMKMQHDTGQNLIYLHVFPKVVPPPSSGPHGGADGAGGEGDEDDGKPALDPSDPRNRVLMAEQFDFVKIVPSKVAPWSHKRRLLSFLQSTLKRIEDIEGKMAMRQELSDAEQALYEGTSRANLEEKAAWLQAQMKEQVSAGDLTAAERETVLKEMEEKLAAATAEVNKAEAGSKKASVLAEKRDALAGRRDAVRSAFADASPPTYPVRGIADIKKARLELARLDKLEASTAGKTLTVSEAMARARELEARPGLQERLEGLYRDARGWFESDEEFEGRVKEGLMAIGGAKAARR